MSRRGQVRLDDVEIDFHHNNSSSTASAPPDVTLTGALFGGGSNVPSDGFSSHPPHTAPPPPPGFDPSLQKYLQVKARSGATARRRRGFFEDETTASDDLIKEEEESKNSSALKSDPNAGQGESRVRTSSSVVSYRPPYLPHPSASLATSEAAASRAAVLEELQRQTPEQSRRLFEEQAMALSQGWVSPSTATSRLGNAPSSAAGMAPHTSSSSPTPNPATVLTSFSCVDALLESVPDVEPWDRWALTAPRYDRRALLVAPEAVVVTTQSTEQKVQIGKHTRTVAATAGLDQLHVPVLQDSLYTRYYQYGGGLSASVQAAAQHSPVLHKTKEEKRAEKKERQKQKQRELQRQKETGEKVEDRLRHRNLHNKDLFLTSVLNPLEVHDSIHSQYQLRLRAHEETNFKRHMAALPHQIEKRQLDMQRAAEEKPVLRCYRIYPIYTAERLGKLRNMANDNLLHGFITWTGQVEALVVLAGGEVAARHLDRWIMDKMRWDHDETTAERVCSVRLQSASQFSFRTKPSSTGLNGPVGGVKRQRDGESLDGEEGHTDNSASPTTLRTGREPVFLAFFQTIEETQEFFAERQPAVLAGTPRAPHPSPWRSLLGLYRAAVLGPYLRLKGTPSTT